MPRPRAAAALLPLVALTALVGCAADATEPSPSPSSSATSSPTPSVSAEPEPLTRGELPIDCLNVLAPEIREGIDAAAPLSLVAVDVRLGQGHGVGGVDDELAPIDPSRSASCVFASGDGIAFEITYIEFDPAQTQARLDSLQAFGDGGELYQPPGTDLALEPVPNIAGAQQLQIPFESGGAKTWVVGDGWELYVDAPWVPVEVAAPLPTEIGEGLAAVVPVDQRCQAMLPIPTEQLDLAAQRGLSSSTPITSTEVATCHAGEASGYERVLWWEDLALDARETLLADATAGVDGMAPQGSTNDGSGAIVALADGTRLIVFDAHLVHVELTANGELALQLARHIHAPAWLDVPPVA